MGGIGESARQGGAIGFCEKDVISRRIVEGVAMTRAYVGDGGGDTSQLIEGFARVRARGEDEDGV